LNLNLNVYETWLLHCWHVFKVGWVRNEEEKPARMRQHFLEFASPNFEFAHREFSDLVWQKHIFAPPKSFNIKWKI